MRLAAVANVFNNTSCVDAYTGKLAFKGQFDLFDDSKRDSETAQRRVMSVAPGTTVPARRVIEAGGMRFIVGNWHSDVYRDRTVRTGFVLHEATELSTIHTLAQVCLDQPGTTAWTGRAWVKNMAYEEQSSSMVPVFHLHFSLTESIQPGVLVSFGGRLHIVRTQYIGPAGTLITLCEQVPEPTVETATVTGSGTYDQINDTIGVTTASARVMRLRWQSLFEYNNKTAPTFGPEDIQVAIAKATMTPTAGMKLTLSDGTWKIASRVSEGDVWLCRSVRHA